MSEVPSFRPAPGEIPTEPGVYRFRDANGRVVYVGKAKNLRSRLSNYFQDPSGLHPRTRHMVASANSVEWTVVATEVEALSLEYSWIKEFDPRFNIKYRDDKSYPYLALTMTETYPRAQVLRGAKKKGNRYFGPFSHAWAIRETLDQLLRVFPVRTCSAAVFQRSARAGRPCLLGYIDKCSAPCVGRISAEDHRALAEDLADFMDGDTERFLRTVEAEMREAAAQLDFERAARLRDDAAALARVVERNAIVLADRTDADVFGLAQDELEAAAQVFMVRGGRVRGQRGWIVEKVDDSTDADLVSGLLRSVYLEADAAVPREVLVPVLPTDVDRLRDLLRDLRGTHVSVRVPQRGDKRALAETVTKNAEHALALHKARRSGDLTTRSEALRQLQEALDMDDAPLRIECYDISTTGGSDQVASMVVFEDGLARKSEYRRFQIRGATGQGATDDTAAIHEVIARRFAKLSSQTDTQGENNAPGDGATGGVTVTGEVEANPRAGGRLPAFAYPPNLVVVDGGAPQVAAAQRALEEAGAVDVTLVGLAKRLEEVWLVDETFPLILPRTSEGLYLLQRLRDEAHRFAITYHRVKRSAGMTGSALDDIPGLGPARRKALLTRFGSVARIAGTEPAALTEVDGIGPTLAATIHAALHPPVPGAGATASET
ncbi:MAG: excinuclease ABC subunit UvrC [Bifidobacteriaceae bacterium]|nr:excinuclease ABC subunit UvrC [Bifidobacteriaceae bacterium]